MTYGQGQLITAADFNTFQIDVTKVYGIGNADYGYGQSAINVPIVLGGTQQLIRSAEWTALRNAIVVCENQQGLTDTTPPLAIIAQKQLIRASPPATGNLPQAITNIMTNRLTVGNGAQSVFSNLFNNVRLIAWQSSISLQFTATFSSADAARYFFNSGSVIQFSFSFTGFTANTQNTRWATFLSNIGTVSFGAHNTIVTGFPGGGYTRGYYEQLISTASTIFYTTDPGGNASYGTYGAASVNQVRITAQTNGVQGQHADNGTVITFVVSFVDNLYPYSTAVGPGNFIVTVSEVRSNVYLSGVTGANYTLVKGM